MGRMRAGAAALLVAATLAVPASADPLPEVDSMADDTAAVVLSHR
jgi:hypothetical protein